MHQSEHPVDRCASPHVGLGDRVVTTEDDRDRTGREHLADGLLDRLVGAHRIGGDHRSVAVVDHAEQRERVELRFEVRPRWTARSANPARAKARAGTIGDEVVGRCADDRDINAGQIGGTFAVALTGEGEEPSVVRLLTVDSPARQRIDHRPHASGLSASVACRPSRGLVSPLLADARRARGPGSSPWRANLWQCASSYVHFLIAS
jgi:hypothetical protein